MAVPYYHTVFTLPHEFNAWVRLHPEVIYKLIFQAVWQTLKAFSRNHKRFKAQLGITCVLHTWGQNLAQHVHLHCLIPGIRLSEDKQSLKLIQGKYLYPIRALQRKYRGKLVSLMRQAYQSGELFRIKNSQEIKTILDQVMKKTWVIYIKPYLKKPETILKYLSRYTYKIAISNQRLVSINEKQVTFKYKDYRDGKNKVMVLDGVEFLRRFLQHVLPKGFMRIRHYGFLANSVRKKYLDIIRQLMGEMEAVEIKPPSKSKDINPKEPLCPKCHKGHLTIIMQLKKVKRR